MSLSSSTPHPSRFLRTVHDPLNLLALVSAVLFVFAVLIAAFEPSLIAKANPATPNYAAMLQPPGAKHLFGTDSLGRDVFARVVHGARYSVLIGLGSVALALAMAVPLGIVAGVSGPRTDRLIVRFFDIIAAFPELLLAILVIALLGPGLTNLVVAMGIASVPKFARIARAQTRTVMRSGYIEHVRTLGQSHTKTVLRHVLPNSIGTLPVLSTLGLGYAIINAAGLSFLGLGPQPPIPEWGLMLSEAISNLRVAWWTGVFPGVMITLLVISLTVVGNNLQAFYENRKMP
ncbi:MULTISPECIES: ABC transporter permease [Rhizobium/Agrobacterium group]|uniref:ABC transporter permease protein putative dipeptide transport protein n=1 Tax=Agrobacterium tumefaciens str. Kerr 14 TaxID=1183424 RepID=A0A1S7SDG1_AGRTU|nr:MULTISPECIES: ABC transporter permease [Rhizobium/Agrobacterium group]NTF97805.1 ABC transporter permease [Rhizobium rhizogenes]CUX67030.1 ABC transporter permease protein; putative dipeptide transport protein [Agrobacterium tumefaciens str. Kerr 14]